MRNRAISIWYARLVIRRERAEQRRRDRARRAELVNRAGASLTPTTTRHPARRLDPA